VRDGATVMLVRDGRVAERPLEVLMLRRHPATAFGPVWAFPGGVVEPTDRLPDDAGASRRVVRAEGGGRFWAAALRETAEETGLVLAPEDLHYFSHWITPEGAPKRYDTRFFVAHAPDGHEGEHDGSELVASAWMRPHAVLDAFARGEIDLILPTQRSLEAIARFETVAALLAELREASCPT